MRKEQGSPHHTHSVAHSAVKPAAAVMIFFFRALLIATCCGQAIVHAHLRGNCKTCEIVRTEESADHSSPPSTSSSRRSSHLTDLPHEVGNLIHDHLPVDHLTMLSGAVSKGVRDSFDTPQRERILLGKLYHEVGCFLPESQSSKICAWEDVTCLFGHFGQEPGSPQTRHIVALEIICDLPDFGHNPVNYPHQTEPEPLAKPIITAALANRLAESFGKVSLTLRFGASIVLAKSTSTSSAAGTRAAPVYDTEQPMYLQTNQLDSAEGFFQVSTNMIFSWNGDAKLNALFLRKYLHYNHIWFQRNMDPATASQYQFVAHVRECRKFLGPRPDAPGGQYKYVIPDARLSNTFEGMAIYLQVRPPRAAHTDIYAGELSKIMVHIKVL